MAIITYPVDSTTLILNGHIFNDMAEGDFVTLAPVNDLTSHTNAVDGGVTVNKRSDGDVHNLTIRVQKQSIDDVYLNTVINSESVAMLNGSLKQVFTRGILAGVDSWQLQNGSITTRPTNTSNSQEGNAMMEYVVQFRSARRQI